MVLSLPSRELLAAKHYNYFRDYDPSIGRYLQSDSIGLRGGSNTYGYVLQSPLFLVDTFGLYCTLNFVAHYFGGGGPVDLSTVGLMGQFIASQSVRGAVSAFNDEADYMASRLAKSLCKDCNKTVKKATFTLSDRTVTNMTWEPCLFAVGHSTLFRNASCSLTANCANRHYSYRCGANFSVRDWFQDPLDIGIELPGGTRYRINADWGDSMSGGGRF